MDADRNFYISELSSSVCHFRGYHFCRGNGSKRKTRFGLIQEGQGTYMYFNKTLSVQEGDIVFIPEKVFCYSEWVGSPEIKVTYINCFMNYDTEPFEYEPQKLPGSQKIWDAMLEIHRLLSGDMTDKLQAYSLFYGLLQDFLPNMRQSELFPDPNLQKAIIYIMENWDREFSMAQVAEECAISESKLYHMFQKQLGQTPVSFLNSIKINYAISYLEKDQHTVTEISRLVNFKSENHFRKVFSQITGTTPLKYRKQAQ